MIHWHLSQLVFGGVLFLGTLLVSILVWFINRRCQPVPAALAEKRSALAYFLHAAAPPVQFAAWYYFAFFGIPVALHFVAPAWEAAIAARLHGYFWHLGLVIGFFWFLYRMVVLLEDRLARRAAHTGSPLDDFLFPLLVLALRTLIPVIGLALLIHFVPLPASFLRPLHLALTIAFILALGWISHRGLLAGEKTILDRLDLKNPANYDARGVQTRVRILRKFAAILVWLIVVSAILMLFQEVRSVGKSLLASAGIAGLALTFAANQSLSTLFAGLQLAFTQPIRLGDQVVVQGESGFIEEITFTYVVVRIWDLRRMVVPITSFIQQPFQNWSRGTSLITVVKFRTDFSMPVQVLRDQVAAWLKETPLWDGQTYAMHVTDSDAGSMELRIIASAKTGDAFNLQCWIRERLLAYIHENHAASLPQARQSSVSVPPPVRGEV